MTELKPMNEVVRKLAPFVRMNDDGSFVAPRDEYLARLLSEYKAQRELIEEAIEALEPFATIANIYDGGWVKDDTATTGLSSKLSIRQARNARAAHARLKAADGGSDEQAVY